MASSVQYSNAPPSYAAPVPYGYNQPPPVAYAPQQAQQQVVVVGGTQQPSPVIVHNVQSFAGHIIFACIVFWCCNVLFGLIAFILAMVASNVTVTDPDGARRLGCASIGMSVAGIIVTIIVVIAVVVVVTSASAEAAACISGVDDAC